MIWPFAFFSIISPPASSRSPSTPLNNLTAALSSTRSISSSVGGWSFPPINHRLPASSKIFLILVRSIEHKTPNRKDRQDDSFYETTDCENCLGKRCPYSKPPLSLKHLCHRHQFQSIPRPLR